MPSGCVAGHCFQFEFRSRQGEGGDASQRGATTCCDCNRAKWCGLGFLASMGRLGLKQRRSRLINRIKEGLVQGNGGLEVGKVVQIYGAASNQHLEEHFSLTCESRSRLTPFHQNHRILRLLVSTHSYSAVYCSHMTSLLSNTECRIAICGINMLLSC